MQRRLLIGGVAAALVAATLLLGGVLRGAPAGGGSAPAAAALAGSPGSLARLQAEVRARPTSRGYALLGLAYEQRARETADPGFYTRADGVLRRAAADDPLAVVARGSLALSRHHFRNALALGRRAVALAPYTARGYGVLGDALLELGRYGEAFRTFDRMVSLRPGNSSYARISYARELRGDVAGARAAMRLALDAAADEPEPFAWTAVQLGKIEWSVGHLRAAERWYRAALQVVPGYVYTLDALAQVEAARGRLGRAIALERRAAEVVPQPQFITALGDLYAVSGDRAAARRQYALIGAIRRLFAANGVRTDLESAQFDIDHGVRLEQAVVEARAARADRPSIDGDDTLAWALARTGRCTEALQWSRRALRLGTHDATKLFHRGMIERCLGRPAAARSWFLRALALNPHFSLLWAPVARRYAS
jgi:tetratricopeptide (TPR) repeat protein